MHCFAPSTNPLCDRPALESVQSRRILAQGAKPWLGDRVNHRIVKLNTPTNVFGFTLCQLGADAVPFGLAIIDSGNLCQRATNPTLNTHARYLKASQRRSDRKEVMSKHL